MNNSFRSFTVEMRVGSDVDNVTVQADTFIATEDIFIRYVKSGWYHGGYYSFVPANPICRDEGFLILWGYINSI